MQFLTLEGRFAYGISSGRDIVVFHHLKGFLLKVRAYPLA
jgi:hypothetical protein